MPNDNPPRRSLRLKPTKFTADQNRDPRNLAVISEDSSSLETDTNSEEEMDDTIVPTREDTNQPQPVATVQEIQQQIVELRSQLEVARACAANEKEERMRLQELLNPRQQENAISTPSVPLSVTTVSAAINRPPTNVTWSQNSILTTATSSLICSDSGMSQYAPYTWSKSVYLPPQLPQMSVTQTLPTSSTSTQRVSTFLPPLSQLQPFSQQTFAPQPAPSFSTNQSTPRTGRKLHDLPDFTGRPEDWPMFCTAFQESTTMFGYSKVENIFRLQRCIKGEAKEVVEALLIHPDNVDRVMGALEFRFGRPECLLRSQLTKIREIANIPEGKLELLIPFSTRVQNLATFLESSGLHQHLANPTLIDELVHKLPMSKRLEWAQRSVSIQPYPTVKHFDEWLSGVARLVCIVTPFCLQPQARVDQKPRTRNILHTTEQSTVKRAENRCLRQSEKPQSEVLHATEQSTSAAAKSDICRHCKSKAHSVVKCSAYITLDVPRKWEFVKKNRLCFCCLRYGHNGRLCKFRKLCRVNDCPRVHHSSLHEDQPLKKSTISEEENVRQELSKPLLSCNVKVSSKILFRILPVRLYNDEKIVRTHALLDEGSSVTIISADLAKQLCLKGHDRPLNLQWFGKKVMTEKSTLVDLQISADRSGAERFMLNGVQTVNELNLPTQSISTADLLLSSYHPFAFSLQEYEEAKLQLLIGLDNSHLGAPLRTILPSDAGPIITETKLGWVAYGRTATNVEERCSDDFILYGSQRKEEETSRLESLVEEYFNLENFGVKKPKEELVSANDKRALQILSRTTIRIGDRYQTGLLWKDEAVQVPQSYEMAKRRLWSLENKMTKDPEFAAKYKDIVKSYVKKGYARKLTKAEADSTTSNIWYLPHFGVKNLCKPNKIRLVFDAAAIMDGVSLNSLLLKGPDNLKPLLSILFNFRLRRIAVTGDIKEMYHQIRIQPKDQQSQRFLWRDERDKPIDVYLMQSMTFGASCSPCSANFVKNLNTSRFENDHPRAVRAIVDHHYVDDYVDCFDSEAEAVEVTQAVISIHKSGGFELRNFASNSSEVLRSVSDMGDEEHRNQVIDMNIDAATEKVLGMHWETVEDVFTFAVKFPRVSRDVIEGDRCPTKREFLSIAMSIFDPYGMIADFVVYIKLLLQSVWKHGVAWDEPIPNEIFEKWKKWKTELPSLTQLKILRYHDPLLAMASKIDLHTFVDASEEAFSAVTYLRAEVGEGISVSFICGKTKCAPKKLMSIPRLELSAAVLGIRLCNSIVENHELQFADRVYWSDSKTCINWLRMDPRRNKPFVAFRVAEVLDSTRINQWRWVPSKINPADDATRAKYPLKFQVNDKWLDGPSFLRLPEEAWPAIPDDISYCVSQEELRPGSLLHVNSVSTPIVDISRFSKYLKLQRAVAWVLRFIKGCQRKIEDKGELTISELIEAEQQLCRQAQAEAFGPEINQLRQNLLLERNSVIYKLTPYLDEVGPLRVYGRIDAATTIPFTARRPIIMPKGHPLTKLLVAHFHRLMHHQNDDTIVSEVRYKFWVPSLRSAVKEAKKECHHCRIRTAKPSPPLMGQLPKDRLTPFVRPFTFTGLDYFGPVQITTGRRKEKRWVALFTCMTIRAVHLEVAADLSTDACIMCIRNFVNRRGVPVRIRSDNGTNFIGAKNELTTAEIFDNEAIKTELASKGIEWVFNCPLNPHAGGCWERLVRSVKRVLSHVLHELAPRYETLLSSLIEAENVINSRPLTHLPVSAEEEEPLTPNHFLLGGPNSTQTPGQIDSRALCLRKQWRISQQIKDRFWRRWVREYLPVLTRRCKWFERTPPVAVGELVLICDADVPRSKWIRGRVTRVFPGRDNQVRSAEVKTRMGLLRRPAVKLAVLDVSEAKSNEPSASRGVGC